MFNPDHRRPPIAGREAHHYRSMTQPRPIPGGWADTLTDNAPIVLELVHLSRRFGSTLAVADANLRIEAGEMTGVIGRSGAGKSTLLRLINRLIEPTGGSVFADGVDVTRLRGRALREWRARTAMIFQQFNLVNRLDVLTNVLIGGLIRVPAPRMLLHLFTESERSQAVALLDRLGLFDVAMNRADELSGGQQQRVAIARALMQRPAMVLADEPIASLDPSNAKLVMDALADLNHRDGITVVCNLHTLDTARVYCRRIIGMAAGRIVFDGRPDAMTEAVLREIYGEAEVDERITSTSLPVSARPVLARG
jgi:phosphonate transport system ATP-binding protein